MFNMWFKFLAKTFLLVFILFIFFIFGTLYYSFFPTGIPYIDKVTTIITNVFPYTGSSCPDFNKARSIMKKVWKDIGYGVVSDSFMPEPYPPGTSIDDMGIQTDMGYDKWRYAYGEPYIGFTTEGEWESPYLKQSVKEVSDGLYKNFIPLMEQSRFMFSKSNDIPYYLYPNGQAARKIVFTKNNYIYHFFISEQEKDFVVGMFSIDDKKLSDHPTTIKMSCAKNDKNIRAIYQKRLEYPHTWTNETALLYKGKKDNLITFELQYPGSPTDQTSYEYWADYGNRWELIGSTNNFIDCSLLQKKKVGRGVFCYLPNKEEFSTVEY